MPCFLPYCCYCLTCSYFFARSFCRLRYVTRSWDSRWAPSRRYFVHNCILFTLCCISAVADMLPIFLSVVPSPSSCGQPLNRQVSPSRQVSTAKFHFNFILRNYLVRPRNYGHLLRGFVILGVVAYVLVELIRGRIAPQKPFEHSPIESVTDFGIKAVCSGVLCSLTFHLVSCARWDCSPIATPLPVYNNRNE